MTVTINFSGAIKPKAVVYYVDVADSTDPPELFASEAAALAWAEQHRSDWKVQSELVCQRFEAAVGYKGAVEEAQTGGWYRPGPVPTPRDPNAPGPPHESVYVVHSGLTT